MDVLTEMNVLAEAKSAANVQEVGVYRAGRDEICWYRNQVRRGKSVKNEMGGGKIRGKDAGGRRVQSRQRRNLLV
jgi:hypothetical protein